MMNHVANLQILKKYDKVKGTRGDTKNSFLPVLGGHPLDSSRVFNRVLVRAQYMAIALGRRKDALAVAYLCPLCTKFMLAPVTMSCSHTVCASCVGPFGALQHPCSICSYGATVKSDARERESNDDPISRRTEQAVVVIPGLGLQNASARGPSPLQISSSDQGSGGVLSPLSGSPLSGASPRADSETSDSEMSPLAKETARCVLTSVEVETNTRAGLRCRTYSTLQFVSPTEKDGQRSCHQCKTTKLVDRLVFCTTTTTARSGKSGNRKCNKKYCKACLQRNYSQTPSTSPAERSRWQCPSCLGNCSCARCERAREKMQTANAIQTSGSNLSHADAQSRISPSHSLVVSPDPLKAQIPRPASGTPSIANQDTDIAVTASLLFTLGLEVSTFSPNTINRDAVSAALSKLHQSTTVPSSSPRVSAPVLSSSLRGELSHGGSDAKSFGIASPTSPLVSDAALKLTSPQSLQVRLNWNRQWQRSQLYSPTQASLAPATTSLEFASDSVGELVDGRRSQAPTSDRFNSRLASYTPSSHATHAAFAPRLDRSLVGSQIPGSQSGFGATGPGKALAPSRISDSPLIASVSKPPCRAVMTELAAQNLLARQEAKDSQRTLPAGELQDLMMEPPRHEVDIVPFGYLSMNSMIESHD